MLFGGHLTFDLGIPEVITTYYYRVVALVYELNFTCRMFCGRLSLNFYIELKGEIYFILLLTLIPEKKYV